MADQPENPQVQKAHSDYFKGFCAGFKAFSLLMTVKSGTYGTGKYPSRTPAASAAFDQMVDMTVIAKLSNFMPVEQAEALQRGRGK